MTDALRDAWLNGREDRLGAKGEALAWALRKAWYAQGNDDYGLLKFVVLGRGWQGGGSRVPAECCRFCAAGTTTMLVRKT